MRIGVPREIKVEEGRVGLTPASVAELVHHGHEVVVEAGAGEASGHTDAEYRQAGADVVDTADEVFERAEMIVKVKEPLAVERARLRPHHVLFTYLHLAADRPQADDLIASGATAIAYETVVDRRGTLPLLTPMSQVAGRLAVQEGAHHLTEPAGGTGLLLGGVPGVAPAKVVVIGGGVVGRNAIAMALGLGADVTVLDRDLHVLDELENIYGAALTTRYASRSATAEEVVAANLVVGAVLVRGAKAPKLVTAEMVERMRRGSVIVDVAIDQGGCVETARPTTHADPTYVVDGVVHYCVANMPGAVPRTSTDALNNATLPYVLAIADKGVEGALADDPGLLEGLTVRRGHITHPVVARELDLPHLPAKEALAA